MTASKYSFPTVCKKDQATDWFNSLSKCLHWNKRERQKSFAIVESNRGVHKSMPTTPRNNSSPMHHGLSMTSTGSFTPKPNSYKKNHGTSSSPPPQHKKSSFHDASTSYTSSSDGVPDEVFAMFIEDEYRQNSENSNDEDEEHANESNLFDSDDDSDDSLSIEDSFNGWTDDEIVKARFAGSITREIERLSLTSST